MATTTFKFTFTKTNPGSSFFNTTTNGTTLINAFKTTFGSNFQEITDTNISTFAITGITQTQLDDFHNTNINSFKLMNEYCNANGILCVFSNISL